jgi:hypothetical protein
MERKREIERSELLTLLEQWKAGAINEREVHEQAEALMDELSEHPSYPEHDPRSIPMEVLLHLDALNHQLITPEDIPAMQAFLRTPSDKESQGWADWRSYWDSLDLESRKRELESNPYYCI